MLALLGFSSLVCLYAQLCLNDPNLVTEVARYFYDEGSPELALEMVERMVYESAEFANLTVVNVMTMLLAEMRQHARVLDLL